MLLSLQSEGVIEVPLVYADALMDRAPMDHDELGFSVNDVIAVLDMTDDDWWQGMLEDRMGWFPASWVRVSDWGRWAWRGCHLHTYISSVMGLHESGQHHFSK